MIESDDKAEVETLERNFKTDQKRIDETAKYIRPRDKPQTTLICLFLLMAYIKTC